MVLVDTSVLIDYLKGTSNNKTELLEKILANKIPYRLTVYTYLEILQGTRDDQELKTLEDYLSTQHIIYPAANSGLYHKSALNYYKLRRMGVSPRSTIDLLIATSAIEHKLYLLHNDRDFDNMAKHLTGLKVLTALP